MPTTQLALALVALCNAVRCEDGVRGDTPHEDFTVKVSPECAAFVLAGSGVAGTVALTTVLWPLITSLSLCSGGLCAAGVKGGTLGAAAWLPLVAQGGMIATLQSITMSGAESGLSTSSTVTLGAALGAAGGATYMREFCQLVDEVGPSTSMGQTIKANLELARGFTHLQEAVTPHMMKATSVTSKVGKQRVLRTVTSIWNRGTASFAKWLEELDQEEEARELQELRKVQESNIGSCAAEETQALG